MNNYTHIEKKDYGYRIAYQILHNGILQFHRLDGPAVPLNNSYYILGQYLTENEYWNHSDVIAYKNEQLIKELMGIK